MVEIESFKHIVNRQIVFPVWFDEIKRVQDEIDAERDRLKDKGVRMRG